ncbi:MULTISPECIES: hypothetical protein [Clostridium]|nr:MULTISPECIES: hypothetical protein [Clostridium]
MCIKKDDSKKENIGMSYISYEKVKKSSSDKNMLFIDPQIEIDLN